MNKIGFFFGTETGTTRLVAKKMHKKLSDKICDKPINVNRITPADMMQYDALILGTPSYGVGEIPGHGASGCFEPNWAEFFAHVRAWVAAHALTPSDVDCATAVMLKILDGKCKMGEVEKRVMAALYDALCDHAGERFGEPEHVLIATARKGADDAMKNAIYERRVLAETAISRPVMKAFKAMIRAGR